MYPNKYDFRYAAENGQLDILKYLIELSPERAQAMIAAGDYYAFRFAARNGHLDVLQYLIGLSPELVQAMIAAGDYYAFRFAARNAHLDVLQYLIGLSPELVQEMIAENNYHAFWGAASEGHLDVLKYLIELSPERAQAMVGAKDYYAFCGAAANGYFDVLKYLVELSPERVQAMIEAHVYGAFRRAAEKGRLDVLKYLIELSPERAQAMIVADDYGAFRGAAENGHLDVLKYLVALVPERVQAMIVAKSCYAFGEAIKNGQLDVLKYLIGLSPGSAQAMIAKYDYAAFHYAAEKGHLNILKYLIELSPQHTQAMINARRCSRVYFGSPAFAAFSYAAENGHLDVLTYLVELSPERVEAMIAADNYYALREAIYNHHLNVVTYLLSFPVVLAYAEAHTQEYHQITVSYIDELLQQLHGQALASESQGNTIIFDISPEEASRYFYVIRNLIRRNQAMRSDELRFLISIPAIKALLHLDVTPGRPNELLRLALHLNNVSAAQILLSVPAVHELAAAYQFYEAEQRGRFNLRELAADRESSMYALSTAEQQRLSRVLHYYQPMIESQGGVNEVFHSFKKTLSARYKANPALIQGDNGVVRVLPESREEFDVLQLRGEPHQRALSAYYLHPEHTALRYLSKPNKWMAVNAAYVNRDVNNKGIAWSTFEEYIPLLSVLWLAASDKMYVAIDGHSVETRIECFIKEVALIGRAHNWDKTRAVVGSSKRKEEYDDGEGDKPSCYSGVKRRLFQSVLGHALLKLLTMDDIKQERREWVRDYFKQCINERNREALQQAWMNVCESAEVDECLHQLNITPQAQDEFIRYLEVKYVQQLELDFIAEVRRGFIFNEVFPCHAVRFAGEVALERLFYAPTVVPGAIKVQIKQILALLGSIRDSSRTKTTELTILLDSLEEHSRAYLYSADRERYQRDCAHAFVCYEQASNTLPHSTLYSLVQCIYRVMHDLLQLIGALFTRKSKLAPIAQVGLFAPSRISSSVSESIDALKQCIELLPDAASELTNPI